MVRKESPASHAQLEELIHQYNHLRNDRHQTSSEAVRRRLLARLRKLGSRFEQLISHLIPDAAERQAWRQRLFHAAPAPASQASAVYPTLVFRGRSELGSTAEVREHSAGSYRVHIDGALIERTAWDLAGPPFIIERLEYRELFEVSGAALQALSLYISDPRGAPPWEYARELIEEHLVDVNFALLPRGRRALASLSGRSA